MTHGDITIEIKSDALSEAISVRDFLVTCSQVLRPGPVHSGPVQLALGSARPDSSHPFRSPSWRSEPLVEVRAPCGGHSPTWRSQPLVDVTAPCGGHSPM